MSSAMRASPASLKWIPSTVRSSRPAIHVSDSITGAAIASALARSHPSNVTSCGGRNDRGENGSATRMAASGRPSRSRRRSASIAAATTAGVESTSLRSLAPSVIKTRPGERSTMVVGRSREPRSWTNPRPGMLGLTSRHPRR